MTHPPVPQAPRVDPRGEVIEDDRPWGRFERYTHNEPSTVKLIAVNPGQRLSLQRHEHRDELWVVTVGPVLATVQGCEHRLNRSERIWIPRGTLHRLANPGATTAQVLEIAFGHFDEGDIERLQDDYSRD